MARLQVTLDLTDDQIKSLADDAIRFGWLRHDARKKWTKAEYREAARCAVEMHAFLSIDSKG